MRLLTFARRALSPSKDDIAEFHSAGGGGYGDSHERPVKAVVEDVVAGLLSVEKAYQDYGIIIDADTLAVNLEATEKMRGDRRSAALT